MENNVTPYRGGEIIDEKDLGPEERARFPWNDPSDFPGEEPDDIKKRPLGLWIVEEEDWDFDEENRTTHEEEPDINLIYGYCEESEFY